MTGPRTARKRKPLGVYDVRRQLEAIRKADDLSLEALAAMAGYAGHGHVAQWMANAPTVDLPVARLAAIAEGMGYAIRLVKKESL